MGSKVFKAKNEYCHVFNDKIVLSKLKDDRDASNLLNVDNNSFKIAIKILHFVFLIWFAYYGFINEVYYIIVISLFWIGSFVYKEVKSYNLSSTNILEKASLKEVKLKDGVFGFTQARFEITFINESGKLKKRLIVLLGSLKDDNHETENALTIMREEGYLY